MAASSSSTTTWGRLDRRIAPLGPSTLLIFASGAIRILQDLQCELLCFGTDTKHPFDYAKFAHFEKENQLMIDDAFQRLARQNATYSQK